MKKTIFILYLFLLLLSSQGFSQADRLRVHGGFDYEFIILQREFTDDPIPFPYYGISFGVNYVLVHSNDVFSLGVNPNVNFAFSFSGNGGISLMGQGPIYLLAKYGAGSTNYNEQRFGIGVGIGVAYTYFYYNNPAVKISQGFATPDAMVELSYKVGGSVYSIRAHKSLIKAKHALGLGSGLGQDDYLFSTFGFGLVYSF